METYHYLMFFALGGALNFEKNYKGSWNKDAVASLNWSDFWLAQDCLLEV